MALEKNQAFLEAFGKRVKALRIEKGLSLRAMADILNIDNHQLSRVEEAEINTSILMAYSLAKVLEVPLSTLFDFEV
jgi:transcriptional regulator with XRE-family HTH domain